MLGHSLAKPLIETTSANQISCSTDGPEETKHENVLNLSSEAFDLIIGDFLYLSVVVLLEEAINQTHARLSNIVIDSFNNFRQVLPQEVAALFQHVAPKGFESLDDEVISLYFWRESVHPTIDKRLERKTLGFHINHTTAGDSSRGGDCKIFDFEHHRHSRSQLNNLT